ncbi:MAG: TRAP transporter TatT component family protein, partial [Thermoanaerobaculia bacterium]
ATLIRSACGCPGPGADGSRLLGVTMRFSACWRIVAALFVTVALFTSCSLRTLAVNRLGDALAQGGDVFAADDDPELVGDALPFTLKLIESLLAENPRHRGLLLAAAKGFTQYSYGWVQQKGSESADPAEQLRQNERARRLYRRARDYGLRTLAADPGFPQALASKPDETLRSLGRADVPALYWTAAAWGLLISVSKDDPETIADLPVVGAMMDRALVLDESFGGGALHAFLISYEPNRPGAEGDPMARARRHFDRSVELSGGRLASPFVSFAEAVSIQTQNRAEFVAMLQRALEVDPDAVAAWRTENHLAQRHARWLLAHQTELFLE